MNEDKWRDIVRGALRLHDGEGPILGTHFRQLVEESAKEEGLTFPPEEEPELRFGELLKRFPDVVLRLTRSGMDMLIAPAERPELLVPDHSNDQVTYLIRPDLFNAVTRVEPPKRPWYDPEEDVVIWREVEAPPPSTGDLIPIPSPSTAQEVELRRAWVDSLGTDASPLLLEALGNETPLASFHAVVRAKQLGRRWHEHRIQHLLQRLREWAEEYDLDWQEDWVLTRGELRRRGNDDPDQWDRDAIEHFAGVLGSLSPDEWSRIHIPLDLVLKMVRR